MIKKGIKDAMPVMLGYFPIAMAFGIFAKSAGIVLVDGVLISILVYAGASQFMAVSMIAAGINPLSIVFATFLINFRHFIMSASIRAKINSIERCWYPIIGFFLTDETFSIVSVKENIDNEYYLIALQLGCYTSWVMGTLVGYLTGMFFPALLIKAMGIALYALFIALLIPACKKAPRALQLAVVAGLLNTFLTYSGVVSKSLSFAISVLVVSFLPVLITKRMKEEVTNGS